VNSCSDTSTTNEKLINARHLNAIKKKGSYEANTMKNAKVLGVRLSAWLGSFFISLLNLFSQIGAVI